MMASHLFVVSAATSPHIWPLEFDSVTLDVDHHGLVLELKVPLLMCSVGAAWAGPAVAPRAVQTVTATVATAVAVRR
jgi:hypothetical protein